jgi:hypothetical protein
MSEKIKKVSIPATVVKFEVIDYAFNLENEMIGFSATVYYSSPNNREITLSRIVTVSEKTLEECFKKATMLTLDAAVKDAKKPD